MAKSELVEDLGDGTGEYSDGAIRWLAGNKEGKQPGSLVKKHPGALESFTSETARDAAIKKHELRRMAAEQGAIEAIREGMALDIRGPAEAVKYIYKAQTTLATSPETGRSSTEAAKFVLSGMDMYHDRRAKETPTIHIKIDNATLQAIQQTEDAFDEDDIIDVTPEDDVPF
jgi:hypothetical protein